MFDFHAMNLVSISTRSILLSEFILASNSAISAERVLIFPSAKVLAAKNLFLSVSLFLFFPSLSIKSLFSFQKVFSLFVLPSSLYLHHKWKPLPQKALE